MIGLLSGLAGAQAPAADSNLVLYPTFALKAFHNGETNALRVANKDIIQALLESVTTVSASTNDVSFSVTNIPALYVPYLTTATNGSNVFYTFTTNTPPTVLLTNLTPAVQLTYDATNSTYVVEYAEITPETTVTNVITLLTDDPKLILKKTLVGTAADQSLGTNVAWVIRETLNRTNRDVDVSALFRYSDLIAADVSNSKSVSLQELELINPFTGADFSFGGFAVSTYAAPSSGAEQALKRLNLVGSGSGLWQNTTNILVGTFTVGATKSE